MVELGPQGREEGKEEWNGEEVAVEEVFVPVGPVCRVRELGVEAHDGGEELSES